LVPSVISHYTILEKLGEGGMGVVYKARDTKLDRDVALKFLPERLLSSREEVARFEQEARAISALADPHIATIHDIDEAEGQRFLVLEFLPGGTLKDKLKALNASGSKLPIADVADYGLQIAEGLSHAHRRGIIHRDIKTDNIMLTEGGHLKITDFGLAKLKSGVDLTRAGSTIGTASYMSPEQFQSLEIDHRSDIFSFGVVLYELLTGRLPFRGEHEASLAYSVVHEEPAAPSSLRPETPEALERTVLRCLEKDPQNRYQTADEIVDALRHTGGTKESRKEAAPGGVRRYWTLIPVFVLLIVILAWFFPPWKSSHADRKSVAVLPFRNMSDDKENEYFSDGITEDIIAQLSKIEELRVPSRASIMRYKAGDRAPDQIARELNVGTILEGSVRRSGNRVRIVADLIDAHTDEHLWTETYDRELTEIFTIQSAVAREIASALKAKLSPEESRRLDVKPTENVEAYTFYLKGRESYYRYHRAENDAAIELFKTAIALDGHFALAFAGLGDAYAQRFGKFGYPAAWLDTSIARSRQAISIDPALGEAYKALSLSLEFKGWLQKSGEALQKAYELNPKYVPTLGNLGFLCLKRGKPDEALPWLLKAIALDPSFVFQYLGVGEAYTRLGDYPTAEQWLDRVIALQPDLVYTHGELCELYLIRGDYGTAETHARKIMDLDPEDVIGLDFAGDVALFQGRLGEARKLFERAVPRQALADFETRRNSTRLGFVLLKLGDAKRARAMLDQSVRNDEEALDRGDEWCAIPYDLACVYAVRGETDESLRWLQKAVDAGWTESAFAIKDPLMETLRKNPKFHEALAQADRRVEEMRNRVRERQKSGAGPSER
jgi:serine/threonine protein kinase/tetratricopeptide (TPR) repeat protein